MTVTEAVKDTVKDVLGTGENHVSSNRVEAINSRCSTQLAMSFELIAETFSGYNSPGDSRTDV